MCSIPSPDNEGFQFVWGGYYIFIDPTNTYTWGIEGNESRRGRPLCLPGNKHNYPVHARSPDLASTGESREFRYILNPPIRISLF